MAKSSFVLLIVAVFALLPSCVSKDQEVVELSAKELALSHRLPVESLYKDIKTLPRKVRLRHLRLMARDDRLFGSEEHREEIWTLIGREQELLNDQLLARNKIGELELSNELLRENDRLLQEHADRLSNQKEDSGPSKKVEGDQVSAVKE